MRAARRARCELLAAARREQLGSAPVIAVTGSATKTTTVKLLAHLLGGPPGVGMSLYANTARDALWQFTRLGPQTTAAVVEASEFPVGNLERTAAVLRPTAAVFTISGLDHYTKFRGSAAAAAEMATLARAVPATGFLVVNADDADLRTSVRDVAAPIVTFGLHPDAAGSTREAGSADGRGSVRPAPAADRCDDGSRLERPTLRLRASIPMCGIVGIWRRRSGERADPALVERMLATILHRGPDAGGIWSEGRVALGHRRLSILDLSAAGRQPMLSPDRRGVLTYNGEIYNSPELRRQLEQEGAVFVGTSDTEVLLAALHAWGPERTIPLLNGMFAFAYLDLRCGSLWLARDRLGIKPLYVAEAGDDLLFASEIKAILAHPGVVKRVDEAALSRAFLVRRRSHDTLFAGIAGMPSGTWWRLTGDGIVKHRYFDLEAAVDRQRLADNHRSIDPGHVIQTLGHSLRESVGMHLASDAPIAAMCSGGVDSSLIAAYAGDGRPGMVGYVADAPVGNGEAAQALRVGRHIGVPIREVAVSRADYLRLWPVCVRHLDGPTHHHSEPALLSVARTCRADGIKVLLTGEGADELFGGYDWHAAAHRYWRRWPWLSAAVAGVFRRRASSRQPTFPLLRPSGSSALHRSRVRMALAVDVEREFLPRRLFDSLAGIDRLSDRAFVVSGLADLVEHLSWVLHRHDHMSMAASIEMRVPFLENRLIDFGMHLPRSVKLRRGQGKWALKTVALERLPRDVVFARKKGFPIPHAYTDGTERLLLGGRLADQLQWSQATTRLVVADLRHDTDLRFLMVGLEIWLRQLFGNETDDAVAEKLVAHAA